MLGAKDTQIKTKTTKTETLKELTVVEEFKK